MRNHEYYYGINELLKMVKNSNWQDWHSFFFFILLLISIMFYCYLKMVIFFYFISMKWWWWLLLQSLEILNAYQGTTLDIIKIICNIYFVIFIQSRQTINWLIQLFSFLLERKNQTNKQKNLNHKPNENAP